jgi:hypothetical protein
VPAARAARQRPSPFDPLPTGIIDLSAPIDPAMPRPATDPSDATDAMRLPPGPAGPGSSPRRDLDQARSGQKLPKPPEPPAVSDSFTVISQFDRPAATFEPPVVAQEPAPIIGEPVPPPARSSRRDSPGPITTRQAIIDLSARKRPRRRT